MNQYKKMYRLYKLAIILSVKDIYFTKGGEAILELSRDLSNYVTNNNINQPFKITRNSYKIRKEVMPEHKQNLESIIKNFEKKMMNHKQYIMNIEDYIKKQELIVIHSLSEIIELGISNSLLSKKEYIKKILPTLTRGLKNNLASDLINYFKNNDEISLIKRFEYTYEFNKLTKELGMGLPRAEMINPIEWSLIIPLIHKELTSNQPIKESKTKIINKKPTRIIKEKPVYVNGELKDDKVILHYHNMNLELRTTRKKGKIHVLSVPKGLDYNIKGRIQEVLGLSGREIEFYTKENTKVIKGLNAFNN